MEALPARDSTNGLSYTHKLLPGVTKIDDYGLTLARDVKMPENLIEHAIEIEKCLRQTKTVRITFNISIQYNNNIILYVDCYYKRYNNNLAGRSIIFIFLFLFWFIYF